jgi:hypothetical protein
VTDDQGKGEKREAKCLYGLYSTVEKASEDVYVIIRRKKSPKKTK